MFLLTTSMNSMKFLKEKVLPLIIGFVAASIVMMAFEYTNSLLFPFPNGFDTSNLEAVRVFAVNISLAIYICGNWLFFGNEKILQL